MKAVLMSIQPQHVYNILIGKKTLELRKRVPKDFKGWVYLYCTMSLPQLIVLYDDRNGFWKKYYSLNKKWTTNIKDILNYESLNGTIPCRFWFDEYITYGKYSHDDCGFYDIHELDYGNLCLSNQEVEIYGKGKPLYALNIKNLEIFDRPKRLSEFKKWVWKTIYSGMDCPPYADEVLIPLTKAPQSWQYVFLEER